MTTPKSNKSKTLPPFPFLPTLPSLLSVPKVPLIHRDLSWLQFNERVLEQARPTSNNLPVERVKFLAISANNLDEFFMVRMASLTRDLLAQKKTKEELSHLTRIENLLLEGVAKFGARQAEILDLLTNELFQHGIHIVQNIDDDITQKLGKELFDNQIIPHLTPPETLSSEKVPQLGNLKMGVVFPVGLWFPISRSLPTTFHAKKGGKIYVFFLDSLLMKFLGSPFRMEGSPGILRLTRDCDVTSDLIDQGTAPTPDAIRNVLSGFDKGRPVRLQYLGNIPPEFLDDCCKKLNLKSLQVMPAPGSLCVQGLWSVIDEVSAQDTHKGRALIYPKIISHLPDPFKNTKSLFAKLSERDYLLHHPYDSFDGFLNWIQMACKDPKVESIEITVYRIGTLSPIVQYLKEAAQSKRVRLLVELRARFDEANNLQLAETLSQAGVEVGFGFGKLKLHAKITLVTRREGDQLKHYTHLSTGNYNAKTAKLYTDLAILTSDKLIGEDARLFFDAVWRGEIPSSFKKLMLAPTTLHRRMLSHIENEIDAAKAGKKARIVAKVNALVDEQVIASLYRASQAGVKIDLIVRGACSLIPRITGLSKNIRVISIIDRFLEHSRIYYFESTRKMYLSSADWMPRNFFRRLEIAFPVEDEKILSYLADFAIPTYLADNVKARELTAQGTWKKRSIRPNKPPVRAQFVFSELSAKHYKGTILEDRA